MKDFIFKNKNTIPAIGFGTFLTTNEQTISSVYNAIKLGYRHIDTATIYKNETEVGLGIKQALNEGICTRADLFITTKLWLPDQSYAGAKSALLHSLTLLDLDYIDLYLIHRPQGSASVEAWNAMIELRNDGYTRNIGVSNFSISDLNILFEKTNVMPVINQVECHPYLQETELHAYHEANGILTEAYAPLMSFDVIQLLEDETLINLSKKHNVTIANIAIAWLLSRNIVVIPKTVQEHRMIENLKSLDVNLDQQDLDAIKLLDRGHRVFINGELNENIHLQK